MYDENDNQNPIVHPDILRLQHAFSKLDKYARYRRRHGHMKRVKDAERRAGPAAPPWLTEDHRDEFYRMFEKAAVMEALTGVPQQVDHIIPINHDDVSGLHVPWNLQVLTDRWNLLKSNSFDGTQENGGWRDALPADCIVNEEEPHNGPDDGSDNERPF